MQSNIYGGIIQMLSSKSNVCTDNALYVCKLLFMIIGGAHSRSCWQMRAASIYVCVSKARYSIAFTNNAISHSMAIIGDICDN